MRLSLHPAYLWTRWIEPRLWWAIVAAVPFGAVLMGLLVASRRIDPAFLLALPVGGAAVLIWQQGKHQRQIALLGVMLSAGLINFFTLPTGTDSRITVSFLVTGGMLGVWALQLFVFQRGQGLVVTPINRPLVAFMGTSLLAFVWSTAFRDPLVWVPGSFPIVQAAALTVNLVLVALSLYVVNTVDDVRWLKLLTTVMIGMGTLSIVLFLVNSPLQYYLLNNGARGLFGAWVVLLAYALALFNRRLKTWQRLLLLLLVLLLVYRYFFLGRTWVSGWLPLGIGCGVLTLARSRGLFVVLFSIGLIYVALNFNYFYTNIVLEEEAEGSGTERVGLWLSNFDYVKKHFIFGMGPAGYAVYYMTYQPENSRSTHNNYFDMLAQTGVAGFAMLVWLFATFYRIGYRTCRLTAGWGSFEEAFANATFAGCFAMSVAMMLGDWVLPFAYNQTITGFDNACYTWIFLGGMVSLYRLIQISPSAAPHA